VTFSVWWPAKRLLPQPVLPHGQHLQVCTMYQWLLLVAVVEAAKVKDMAVQVAED
jgi:hypothetical protein